MMDKLLFGDNQFFGVNHMSEEKARAQAMRFRDTAAIISVLDAAYDLGIRTFMCTTHDRIAEIARTSVPTPRRYGASCSTRHAVRPQVRQRGDRERHSRRAPEVRARTRARCGAMLQGGSAGEAKDIVSS